MNSRELVLFSFRDGDCFGFGREGRLVLPWLCCFGNEFMLWLHVGTCATVSQNSGMLEHLEFWETVYMVICIVEHVPHVGWMFDCCDGFMLET